MKLAITKAGSQSYMRHGGSKHVGNIWYINLYFLDKYNSIFRAFGIKSTYLKKFRFHSLEHLDHINNLTGIWYSCLFRNHCLPPVCIR